MRIYIMLAVLLGLSFSNVENIWSTHNGQQISTNKIIVKINSEFAPQLGIEQPIQLSEREELSDAVANLPVINFEPLIRSYSAFTDNHRKFDLHQYYRMEFESSVDIIELKTQLEQLSSVDAVDLNYMVSPTVVPNDPNYSEQWAHDNTGQAGSSNVGSPDCDMDTDEAWDVTVGSEDITVAILDTGINSHVEFEGKLLPGYNPQTGGSDVSDVYGHGTQCAGVSAARGNNDVGVAGVAWESKLLPVKVLNNSGSGDQFDLADGIIWATDNGANVISMSLQFGQNFVNACNSAIDYASAMGVIPMAASANFNESTVTYPAKYENCVAVGGLSPCNERKSFSSCDGESYWGASYGEDLEFVTPCVLIPTTSNTGGYTMTFNGTSSACPAAAGVAALVLSVAPQMNFEEVRDILHNSCDDLYSPGWDIETGWGRLNAKLAVDLAFELSCENNWILGDVNNDSLINVLDLVVVANLITGVISEPEICEEWAADYNANGIINVLDIIQIINIIVAS